MKTAHGTNLTQAQLKNLWRVAEGKQRLVLLGYGLNNILAYSGETDDIFIPRNLIGQGRTWISALEKAVKGKVQCGESWLDTALEEDTYITVCQGRETPYAAFGWTKNPCVDLEPLVMLHADKTEDALKLLTAPKRLSDVLALQTYQELNMAYDPATLFQKGATDYNAVAVKEARERKSSFDKFMRHGIRPHR